jgi:hypothetical protein
MAFAKPDKWTKGDKVGPETKINKDAADWMKNKLNEWKRKEHSKKLEEGMEKAIDPRDKSGKTTFSSRSLDEVKSGSKIGSIDTAGRIRQGIKKGGKVKKNTSRENRLEELGRVDAERGRTKRGKRNLKSEKRRIVRELHSHGGSVGSRGVALKGFGKEIR